MTIRGNDMVGLQTNVPFALQIWPDPVASAEAVQITFGSRGDIAALATASLAEARKWHEPTAPSVWRPLPTADWEALQALLQKKDSFDRFSLSFDTSAAVFTGIVDPIGLALPVFDIDGIGNGTEALAEGLCQMLRLYRGPYRSRRRVLIRLQEGDRNAMIRQVVGPVTDSDAFVRASRVTDEGKGFLREVGARVRGLAPDSENILEHAFRFWLDFPDYLQRERILRARVSMGYYVGDISADESDDGKPHRRGDAFIEAKNFVDVLDRDAVERGTFEEGFRGKIHLSQPYDPY